MKYISILLFTLFAHSIYGQQVNRASQPAMVMQVAVWDTYVTKKDGTVMHFDIIAPASVRDTTIIYNYGREYLKSKGQEGQQLTAAECRFCHVRALHPSWAEDIRRQGYYILELKNCD